MTAATTFYTVTDSDFFPGTVALLNSLRLVGHNDPLVVLDNGLTQSQRQRLEQVASVIDPPSRSTLVAAPTLKPFPQLDGASGIIVLIDSDVIVTASLASTLALADQGRICFYPDPEEDRWFAAWQELFSLSRPPRRQQYVNSGFVAFSLDHWPRLLEDWWAACLCIPGDRMFTAEDQPLRYGDQDALNAILMSEVDAESVVVLPHLGASTPYEPQPAVLEEVALACARDGVRVSSTSSLWPSKGVVSHGAAAFGFSRDLCPPVSAGDLGQDVALRLPPSEVPWWLRHGLRHKIALRHHRTRVVLGPAKRFAIRAVGATGRLRVES